MTAQCRWKTSAAQSNKGACRDQCERPSLHPVTKRMLAMAAAVAHSHTEARQQYNTIQTKFPPGG